MTGKTCFGKPSSNKATAAAGDESRVGLQKEISLLHGVAIMTGVMVGSGIFISPVAILAHCGSVAMALVVWVLSGLLMLIIALTYTELGAMFVAAGGEYVFFKKIIGDEAAFLFAWGMSVWTYPSFFALLSLITSSYLLMPFMGGCGAPDTAVRLVGLALMLMVTYLNCAYLRYVARVQTALAAAKFIALIVIIIVGVVQLAYGRTEILATGFEGTNRNPLGVAMGMYAGVFSFNGWQSLFALLEEVKDPSKNVPRCTYISFVLIIFIYLMTNVAYFTVLTPLEMMTSEAVAMTFAEKTMGKLSAVIPLVVACSTIGCLNGSLLGGTRIYFAAARDGLFPDVVSLISARYMTPVPSVFVTCILTITFTLIGNATTLLEYLGFLALLIGFVAACCVLYLRWKEPDRHRPVRMPLVVPVCAALCTLGLMILGLVQNPVHNGIGLLLVFSGLPVYWLGVKWTRKPKAWQRISDRFMIIVQKLLVVIHESDSETKEL